MDAFGGIQASGINPVALTATIATSASLSSAVSLGPARPAAVIVPANTEGSALTFQGSVDGSTWFNLYDADGEFSIDFTDPCIIVLPLEKFLWCQHLKVRTGTAASPTNQSGADATLTVIGA